VTLQPGVTGVLTLRNQSRAGALDLRLLRRIVGALMTLLRTKQYDLGIYIVAAREMTHLNETFLHHLGSTDVITFDYSEPSAAALHGELFICLDEAIGQARRFGTTWPKELTRYAVHGVLHLRGFDDRRVAERRKMKREENRLLRALAAQFDLRALGKEKK
jgi:rRNA maturation RNase YbeY